MRRFTRRRRAGGAAEAASAPIDATRWLARIAAEGHAGTADLETLSHPDVPADFAAIGRGAAADGSPIIVSFAPRWAGDALLAALATGARLAEEESFAGTLLAIAPEWSIEARRRLGLVRAELPYRLKAVAVSSLAEGITGVEPEAALEPSVVAVEQVIAQVADASARALFRRAAASLDGLASKHGGSLRGVGGSVELVLLARRVAELRLDGERVVLTTLEPQRSSADLDEVRLAAAFDGLEGQLRRRLGDRRLREGEEGMRTRVIPLLERAGALRATSAWPLGGAAREEIDLVGLDADGHPVVAAARASLSLRALGSILDAAQSLRLALPGLFANAAPPVRIEAPRLMLAASEFGHGALRALSGLALGHALFEIRASRDQGFELAPIGAEEAARSLRDRATRERPRGAGPQLRGERPGAAEPAPAAEAQPDGERPERAAEEGPAESRQRGRRRGRGRGRQRSDEEGRQRSDEEGRQRDDEEGRQRDGDEGRQRGDDEGRQRSEGEEGGRFGSAGTDRDEEPAQRKFEEVSLFDLDDGEAGSEGEKNERENEREEDSLARRRRGRSRRRGRRGSGGDADVERADSAANGETGRAASGVARSARGAARGRSGAGAGAGAASEGGRGSDSARDDDDAEADEEFPDGEDLTDVLAELPEEIETPSGPPAPVYTDEEASDEETEDDFDRELERARRRRARKPEPVAEVPRPPRRRAVIIVHQDRDSLLTGILLAREIRLIEGLWVYSQAELMNFFRGVATDLRDDVPIHLIGFVPSPARDVIQAASLYRDRLTWFDHHDWPPEDVPAIQQAVGADAVHHTPGAGSSLPALLATCARRSRFSDKLVDLVTGRFSEHDFERWGRLWLWRLGEIASKTGDVRADVELLLDGRPSDLAKEAALVQVPPTPPEVEYSFRRDFRLVHFAGYAMVIADVKEEDLDLHLVARIARERYDSSLSLAYRSGSNLFLFGGEEVAGRRMLDFAALSQHLGDKLDWVEALADDDHVARFRILDLDSHPGRLNEVIGEIAMGRSILER